MNSTAPVKVIRPIADPIALVCDSPHSGTYYPQDFDFAIELAQLRQCEDTLVEQLWDAAPLVGATLVQATFPRSYIDPNRSEDDIDLAMLDGEWDGPVAPSQRCLQLGNGLVFSQTPARLPIYSRRLHAHEIAHRIESCWRPYRRALADALAQSGTPHGERWHLNLHSMPSNAYERLGLPDKPLADIVLGNLHGASCGADFADFVGEEFRRQGYTVALNDPYAGQDLVRTFGRPAQGQHSLQIEINRSLYLDEKTREPKRQFPELRKRIHLVLQAIAGYIREEAARSGRNANIKDTA
jgi:N-formylglutamate deformylase